MENDEIKAPPMGETPQEKGISHVPECYKVPPSMWPSSNREIATLPVVDLSGMKDPDHRAEVVKNIGNACRHRGFFQVVNHGIEQSVLDGALETAFAFFDLPVEEKARYMSNDVREPVRYGTSLKHGLDKIQFWRVFLKHYANPLNEWVKQWPDNPPDYRGKMSAYAVKVQALAGELARAVTESLGIGQSQFGDKIVDGTQVMVVNYYPICPNPSITLGLPPHTDYSCLTIVLQSSHGLEIMDTTHNTWRAVPESQGALQVHVGDHVEVLSNGLYKSAVHRAALNSEKTRVSITSLHSLGMDEKMGTSEELVDEHRPRMYKDSSFNDFLNFLSKIDIAEGKSFIETLKMSRN